LDKISISSFKDSFYNKRETSHEQPSLMQELALVLQEGLVEQDIKESSFKISHSTPMLIFSFDHLCKERVVSFLKLLMLILRVTPEVLSVSWEILRFS
jgi:hypothetical protein